jgi:HK97 family phage major capsid protein
LRCALRGSITQETDPMMTKEKLADLQATGQKHIADAREIAEKHGELELEEWPAEDRDAYNDLMAKATALLPRIKAGAHDLSIIDQARALAEEIGIGGAGPGGSLKGQRLHFKGAMAGSLARSIAPEGTKALAPSGATVVAQEFRPDPVALGQPAVGMLDLLPVITHSTPEISYLRQTSRSNAAAVVAAGALKPTSVYSVTKITNSLQVIAHLSEGIARHWLLDNGALEQFLANELEYGLQVAVEAKVFADINGTSGIQSQAYATSVLATLRKGITKLEQAGYSASAFVLTPADWEGVELSLSSVNAVEHLALPYDPAARRLFGVPIATSVAQTAGVGHLLATGAVALDTDNRGVDVQWSENATADSFGKNLVFARCESRYATSVFSPLGVVTLDLTP